MAKHKAATEITIIQEERSAFAETVDRYKWHGLGLLVILSAFIVWRQRAGEAAVKVERADWAEFYDAQNGQDDVTEALAEAITRIQDSSVASWAGMEKTIRQTGDRSFEAAEEALSQARNNGSAILTKMTFPVGSDGTEETLFQSMERQIATEKAFHAENDFIYSNAPLPDDAPVVEFQTDQGTIAVGLYMDFAPQHVKNMMKLVGEGFYDGVRFHRVVGGQFIQGGDPNSREDDATTWGTGGPGYTVPKEDSVLKHVAGALAAAKPGGAKDSSGSQFYITAQPMHRQFDGGYVVYGQVIEGLEIVESISNGTIREDKAETPVEPVTILTAKIRE